VPLDRERLFELFAAKYGQGRYGGPGHKDFNAKAQAYAEEHGTPVFLAHRIDQMKTRERIYLDQLELLAGVLGVPITELLDSGAKDLAYERGERNGYHRAMAEIHTYSGHRLVPDEQ
jgi:hypothetical protein